MTIESRSVAETITADPSPSGERDPGGGGTTDIGAWLLGLLTKARSEWFRDIVTGLAGDLDLEARSKGVAGRSPRTFQGDVEQAIATLIANAVPAGASAQMVADLLRTLGVEGVTEAHAAEVTQNLNQKINTFRKRSLAFEPFPYISVQGRPLPSREPGGAGDVLIAAALGVGESGRLEMLALDALEGVSRRAWGQLLSNMRARGLSGVSMVVTDGDPGLSVAILEAIPDADVQCSRSQALREVLAAVPESSRSLVSVLVGTIYSQPGAREVRARHAQVVEQLRPRFPQAAGTLAARTDMLAFAGYPRRDWPRIWSVMPGESTGGLGIQQLQPNFFVAAATQVRHAGSGLVAVNGATGIERANGQDALVVHADPEPSAGGAGTLARRINWVKPALRLAALESTLTSRVGSLSRGKSAAAAPWIPTWLGALAIIGVLAAAFAAHAINLFNFPRYELDEGTYVSSAWAILNDRITPYPYGYGHPPLGWFQIAVWAQLSGGFFSFGNALNTGRVLMALYAVASAFLLYLIAAHLSGRRSIGILAMILFSFSPLSLVYQRQVFLDNIAVFWLLLSVYLIITSKSRLAFIVGAGLAFGFAVLSKETAVIFLPVMIYLLWRNISKYQRMFGLITFTYAVLGLGFGLVLMALMRGELFPYEWHLPWDHHPHLSLLDTLSVQIHRSQSEGSFAASWQAWTSGDSLLVGLGIGATAFNLVVGLWRRDRLFVALAGATYWALLLRGGVVLPFYVIILIPLVALNAALALDSLLSLLRRFARVELASVALVACVAATIVAYDFSISNDIFTQRPTVAQTEAMVWIRNHVSPDSVVVINSYLYMDLREPGGAGVGDGATYPYAHVYWNMAYDPELHDGLLQDNWDRIDYIVADSEMLRDIATAGGEMVVIDSALKHSVLRQEFRQDDNETLKKGANSREQQIVISIYQVTHKMPPSSAFDANGASPA